MQFERTSLPPRHLVCPECVTVPLCPVSADGHLLPALAGEGSSELPGDVSGRTAFLPAILGCKGSVLGWDLALLLQAPTVHLLRVELHPSQVGTCGSESPVL